MFITEEQYNNIMKNPRNLANRFKNGRQISQNSSQENDNATSGSSTAKEEEESIGSTSEKSECINASSALIKHRELKRPGNNRPWLSKQERTEIATKACNINSTQTEIAKAYGVQVSTVSDIVNNARRVDNSPRAVDQAKVDAALDKVREAAIDKLMAGLGQLTEDKVSAHNAKDISVICANMARVVQQTIPQEKAAQQINLVVYTPELRAEKSFEVIEI